MEDRGWHVNKSRKAKYSYHEVEADPSLSWNDGSSEDVLSLGHRHYDANIAKRTERISKGTQLAIRDHHVVQLERGLLLNGGIGLHSVILDWY